MEILICETAKDFLHNAQLFFNPKLGSKKSQPSPFSTRNIESDLNL